MQRSSMMRISASGARLSGLWHQTQSSGQPFRNTVVRMPGPSWIEKRWISKQRPVGGAWACSRAWADASGEAPSSATTADLAAAISVIWARPITVSGHHGPLEARRASCLAATWPRGDRVRQQPTWCGCSESNGCRSDILEARHTLAAMAHPTRLELATSEPAVGDGIQATSSTQAACGRIGRWIGASLVADPIRAGSRWARSRATLTSTSAEVAADPRPSSTGSIPGER